MNPDQRYQLTKELEKIKHDEQSTWTKLQMYGNSAARLFGGAIFLTLGMRAPTENTNTWFVFLFALMSVAMIVSGLYVIVSYNTNKKLKVVLEALLSEKESIGTTFAKQ